MNYFVIGYVGIGLFLCYALKLKPEYPYKKERALLWHPGFALLVILFWPALVAIMIPRIKNFKFRGKVVWERK